jgi:hypothetical protein
MQKLDASIIYAGNRTVAKEISDILSDYDLHIASNVLPELDRLNPEDSRDKIREIFLDRIVCGRGLDKIVKEHGVKPLPTPYSMFEFLKKIYQKTPSGGGFLRGRSWGSDNGFLFMQPDGGERIRHCNKGASGAGSKAHRRRRFRDESQCNIDFRKHERLYNQ